MIPQLPLSRQATGGPEQTSQVAKPTHVPQTTPLHAAGAGALLGAMVAAPQLATTDQHVANRSLKQGQALAVFELDMPDDSHQAQHLKDKICAAFRTLDTDNNHFISKDELLAHMQNKQITGKEAAMVALLLQLYDKGVRDVSNDEWGFETNGLSLKDIEYLDFKETEITQGAGMPSLSVAQYYQELLGKINQASRKADGTLQLPQKTTDIRFQDIQQGSLGDCYFLAALTSLAQQRPQDILNRLQDNHNGTYTVQFADRAVTISSPTDTELAVSAAGQSWVPLLEKAYAKYRNEQAWFPSENAYAAMNGRNSFTVGKTLTELTGQAYQQQDVANLTLAELRTHLMTVSQQHKITMTTLTNKNNSLQLPAPHAYAIIGFDATTNQILLRNPWGQGGEPLNGQKQARDGKSDSVFYVTLAEFKANFLDVLSEK